MREEEFARRAAENEATAEKLSRVKDVLAHMKSKGVSYGDILLFLSDPTTSVGFREDRYWGFFSNRANVRTVLDNWASSANSKAGRITVQEWAVNLVSSLVAREGNAITRHVEAIQGFRRPINADFARDFDLPSLHQTLTEHAPYTTSLLQAFATTARQRRKLAGVGRFASEFIGSAVTTLLRARSQRNNYIGQVMGLYLYATGSSRQVISVVSHLGLSCSYQALVGTRSRHAEHVTRTRPRQANSPSARVVLGPHQLPTHIPHHDPTPSSRAGILRTLSDACRTTLRVRAQRPRLAENDELANIYDNINFMFKAAEQILGRKDSQENGTCATAFTLYKAPREYLRTSDLIQSFTEAPPLTFRDIRLTSDETSALRERLVWTVMNIVVQYGGESFRAYKADLASSTRPSTHRISPHKTEIFPMPAMEIDESSTTGNAKVLDAMFAEMGYDTQSSDFRENIRIVFGDQLSMARVRAVTNTRVGHDDPANAYLNVVFAPGFFHYQMAGAHGVLHTHWGDPSLGTQDPASLSFHNAVLDRKPVVLSSLPPYRTCRDLIFVSLYARILHCLELVSGHDLDNYASATSFDQFQEHAATIEALRSDRDVTGLQAPSSSAAHPLHPSSDSLGDIVYENAVLFLRDTLLLRHFADCIKSGTSDHLVTVLKLWAIGFRAMGRMKYAHELLHLIHNLTHVWPRPLRCVIMNNWLVNTTGNVDGFIPVDLLQEHLNFWIKVIYKAHGSNASWEWLEEISPCIEVLRQLATQINAELGSHQGTKHHAPDLTNDIRELMRSLHLHGVYTVESDRPGKGSVKPVPNVYSVGIHLLARPLADYNSVFRTMQKRRTMQPVVGQSALETFSVELRDTPPSDLPASESSRPDNRPEQAQSRPERPQDSSEGLLHSPPSEDGSDSNSSDGDDAEHDLGIESNLGEMYRELFFTLDGAEDVELDMDGY
ncbi:hypothetical protein BD413DRAFT_483338 [Trametes elegans]|nr:hypothetical protein BD413DRAFT_483338 [Trametes elegans]